MLLIIDIGNSLVKYHFNRQTFFEIDDLASAISASLHQYSGSIGIDTFRVFIVSTRKSLNATEKDKTKVLLQGLQKQYALWFPIEFNEELLEQKKLLKDVYRELGDDRQIKVLGALKMFENMNIALFDFGSATTLTLVNSKYQFKGHRIDLGFLKSSNRCSVVGSEYTVPSFGASCSSNAAFIMLASMGSSLLKTFLMVKVGVIVGALAQISSIIKYKRQALRV